MTKHCMDGGMGGLCMRKHLSTIFLTIVFFTGLSLILYPTISDYWNTLHQSEVITEYAKTAAELDDTVYEKVLSAAYAYNDAHAVTGNSLFLSEEDRENYAAQLNISEQGIMCYIEIPEINCRLPVYHGTDERILQTAVGHIEGSSLPVGGESTHCVLSGHRGLPSAKLFTDLDKLKEGDLFIIYVLDETVTYEVDRILVVLPEEVEPLAISEGEDLCTLVTCTPYGVNTHRMLVRGRRVTKGGGEEALRVTADAVRIETPLVISAAAVPLLLFFMAVLLTDICRKRKGSVV